MLFDTYTQADADQHIRRIQDLWAKGVFAEKIAEQLKIEHVDELLSIAKARQASEKTAKDYFMLEEDLRFATNELVAEHRAKRLACNTLIEIGCGIGIQTIAFAKTCKKVIAVDIDARKVAYAKANAAKRKITNVTFLAEDGLQTLKTHQADVIFCDPGRPAAEEVRDIETSFSPHVPTLIKEAKKTTENIAIELPPQIQTDFPGWELEFTSVDHQLNRLTAYKGALAKAESSACVLPQGVCVSGMANKGFAESAPLQYLFEVDPAVIKAGLTWKLDQPEKNLFRITDALLTSMRDAESPFFKARYHVITVAKKFADAKAILKREKAGKVILHGSISNEQYWHERKKFEEGLAGTRTLHVFLGNELIVCRLLNEQIR
ncbi:class I SAM-dependent methyltransferase [Candidatus Woesearchaeota archaeon]|nr:class I SAM-dependent methyltransferase [Candidatus Woesearchaeota archaeon]